MMYDWLSDEDLAKKVEELRIAAHEAPKTGSAWQQRANDWVVASTELARRRKTSQ